MKIEKELIELEKEIDYFKKGVKELKDYYYSLPTSKETFSKTNIFCDTRKKGT